MTSSQGDQQARVAVWSLPALGAVSVTFVFIYQISTHKQIDVICQNDLCWEWHWLLIFGV